MITLLLVLFGVLPPVDDGLFAIFSVEVGAWVMFAASVALRSLEKESGLLFDCATVVALIWLTNGWVLVVGGVLHAHHII